MVKSYGSDRNEETDKIYHKLVINLPANLIIWFDFVKQTHAFSNLNQIWQNLHSVL